MPWNPIRREAQTPLMRQSRVAFCLALRLLPQESASVLPSQSPIRSLPTPCVVRRKLTHYLKQSLELLADDPNFFRSLQSCQYPACPEHLAPAYRDGCSDLDQYTFT